MVMADGSMAWALPSRTVAIALGREEPVAPQVISRVSWTAPQGAHQFDSRTLGTGVVHVRGRKTHRVVGMRRLTCGWREKTKMEENSL